MSSYYDQDAKLNFYYYGDDEAPTGTGKGKQEFPVLVNSARAAGQKWEDPNFPADERSLRGLQLNYSNGSPLQIEWKRPSEISAAMFDGQEPLFRGNYSQFNVKQGSVGDCWFLAVLADAATKSELISTLVPEDNHTIGFDSGVFHFRFWCRGKWVDVPVDDRLPVVMQYGKISNTVMSKPTKDGGFWAPLLEKAYAKVYGTYGDIEGGLSIEAMEDFSGGVNELYMKPDLAGDKLKSILTNAVKTNCLISFGTDEIPLAWRRRRAGVDPGQESVSVDGITGGHAYTVLDIKDVTSKYDPNTKFTLVSCRNPWGTETEWNGDFSDTDPNGTWKTVTTDLRTGTTDDGQFWMPIENFQRYASELYVCRWGSGYRGDQTVEPVPGAIFYLEHNNFTQANSGQITNSGQIEGHGGYLVDLKCLPEYEGQGEMKNGLQCNAGLSINMIYKNYKKSGRSSEIPAFGFYAIWSACSDPTDPMFTQQMKGILFTAEIRGGRREVSYRGDLPKGTVLVFPWIQYWDGKESPYLIRIIAEGKVRKLEPGWVQKPFDYAAMLRNANYQ